MIDDMDFHTDAWHEILNNDLGADMSRESVKLEMYGKNQELLVRVFGEERFTDEEKDALSLEKERLYQTRFKPHLKLFPGLSTFLEAESNWLQNRIVKLIAHRMNEFNYGNVILLDRATINITWLNCSNFINGIITWRLQSLLIN